jgi:hypothetical protein
VDFSDIFPVTDRLQRASVDEVAAAEAAIGTPFPPGYAEFVTRFGDGSVTNWVRVYPPGRVAEEHADHRARREEYYFWDDGADVLTREQVAASVVLADTLNGDEVVYHPKSPSGLFVLPRDDGMIYRVGSSLAEAIDWLCRSGVLTAALSIKTFEPNAGRSQREFVGGLAFEDARDALLMLKSHDHSCEMTVDDEKYFEMYIKELGGVLFICESLSGTTIGLRTDDGASGAKFDRLIAGLQALGFDETTHLES